jgi:hypothetical protein
MLLLASPLNLHCNFKYLAFFNFVKTFQRRSVLGINSSSDVDLLRVPTNTSIGRLEKASRGDGEHCDDV